MSNKTLLSGPVVMMMMGVRGPRTPTKHEALVIIRFAEKRVGGPVEFEKNEGARIILARR